MQERSNNGAILFAIGVLFGATITSLILPKSGKEIRQKIKDSFDQVHDETTGKIKDAAEKVKDSSHKVADKVQQMGNKSAENLESVAQTQKKDII